jgi:hypothetical protein
MDEVKLKVYVPQDGAYGLVPQEGGSPVEEETCYLKSEVDKVVENLQLKYNVQFCAKVAKHHQLLHQKYKRCMAMADWCKESLRLMRTYEVTDDYWNLEPGHDAEYFCKKGNLYSKWRKRWLKLAEKFKE